MTSIGLSKRRNFIDSEELQPLISSDSHFHPLSDSDDSELRICMESTLELESIYRHYRGIGGPLGTAAARKNHYCQVAQMAANAASTVMPRLGNS